MKRYMMTLIILVLGIMVSAGAGEQARGQGTGNDAKQGGETANPAEDEFLEKLVFPIMSMLSFLLKENKGVLHINFFDPVKRKTINHKIRRRKS